MLQKPDKASPRQIRQLDFIAQFSTNIDHISGKQNFVADALSRIDSITMPIIVSLEELALEAQLEDTELKTYQRLSNYKNLYLRARPLLFSAIALLNVYVLMSLIDFEDEFSTSFTVYLIQVSNPLANQFYQFYRSLSGLL